MSLSSSNSAGAARAGVAGVSLPAAAVCAGLLAFAGLQLWAYALAGVFEYPLDDVYIHLAMAKGIASGTYGINPGEPASAASSVLYPVLLLPFAGSEAQRMLPLLWNALALLGCAWLWGRALVMAGIGGAMGLALALAGPVGLNMAGVAFTGMEHEIHAALSLAVVLGLAVYLREDRIAPWFIAAAVLSPLFRYEGLALSLGAAAAVALTGRLRAGLAIGLGALLPVLTFAAFLMSQGLEPLPSSVLVKMDSFVHGMGPIGRVVLQFLLNLLTPAGWLVGTLTALLASLAWAERRAGRRALLPLILALSGLAHLLFGQVGWMHRYEHYIIVAEAAGLVLALGRGGAGSPRLAALVGSAAVAAGVAVFVPPLTGEYVDSPRALHLQQAQMARFAQDYLDAPVAVNDIGRVSWGNRNYVLDLWGLASQEARHIRVAELVPPPGWAGRLAVEHGAVAAMVYDQWLRKAVPADWVPLAHLRMDRPGGALAFYDVTFYATGPQNVAPVVAALRRFAPSLPGGAHMQLIGPAAE